MKDRSPTVDCVRCCLTNPQVQSASLDQGPSGYSDVTSVDGWWSLVGAQRHRDANATHRLSLSENLISFQVLSKDAHLGEK